MIPQITTIYGVWIPGKGWLRNDRTGEPLADYNREVMYTAAKLYGNGAEVLPYDKSLVDIEPQLLAEQAKADEVYNKRWTVRVQRWIRQWPI